MSVMNVTNVMCVMNEIDNTSVICDKCNPCETM